MITAFLLVVYLGNAKISASTYFHDIDRCRYFAERINKQPGIPPRREIYIAVCEIKQVNPSKTRVYR